MVGGVLQGQELIKQANIVKLISAMSDINRSALTFRTKYGMIPGDFNRATNVWGAAGNTYTLWDCLGFILNYNRTGKETCNGDGNGNLMLGESETYYERMVFWQHLQNAELINGNFLGNFSGAPSAGAMYETKFKGTYISVSPRFRYANQDSENKNIFIIGGDMGEVNMALGATLSPEMAYGIDSKLDDGKPNATGKAGVTQNYGMSENYNGPSACIDSSVPPQYDMTDQNNKCSIFVEAAF